ncbi:MAG: hypothetical protein FWG36_08565 [Oscillospiraceae bacterium]|nr:hypothetical protein [Oscillospiraceae bacterium]
MDDVILNVKTLPESLNRRFRSDRVRVREENGVVTLTPIANTEHTELWGLLPKGLFTKEEYFAQKRHDKELEP